MATESQQDEGLVMEIQQSSPNDGVPHDDIALCALKLSTELYTSTAIKPFDPALSEKIAGYNRLFQAYINGRRVRWLAASQSSQGDWGINRGGLSYLLDELQKQKIAAGVVVLVKKREVISTALVGDVGAKLKAVSWLDLGRGAFCWIDVNFNPIDRHRERYITDPDASW
jgi:hypothetical protein